MPTVHNLHQPLFGYRPCTASHSLRRHDQRTDRLDSDLLLVPLASDFLIEVSLDPLAPRLANAYTIGARRAQLVHASRPLNESINANYYYVISNSSSSFKNQKLDLCSPSGSTSASNPEASFVFHSLSHKALLPQAITPQTRQQGSLHVLTPKERPHRGRHRPQDREICNGSTPSRRRQRLPSMAHFGKLLLLLGANHVQIGHDFQPGYVFGQRKAAEPVELRTPSFSCYARSKAHRTRLDKQHRARVTSHTPLALSARVQAAQCVSTQTFNRL